MTQTQECKVDHWVDIPDMFVLMLERLSSRPIINTYGTLAI